METWKLKVAEATDEFSAAKEKENEAHAILLDSEGLFDQARRATLRNDWLRLKRESQQKNHAVLRLIQSIPKEKNKPLDL